MTFALINFSRSLGDTSTWFMSQSRTRRRWSPTSEAADAPGRVAVGAGPKFALDSGEPVWGAETSAGGNGLAGGRVGG